MDNESKAHCSPDAHAEETHVILKEVMYITHGLHRAFAEVSLAKIQTAFFVGFVKITIKLWEWLEPSRQVVMGCGLRSNFRPIAALLSPHFQQETEANAEPASRLSSEYLRANL